MAAVRRGDLCTAAIAEAASEPHEGRNPEWENGSYPNQSHGRLKLGAADGRVIGTAGF